MHNVFDLDRPLFRRLSDLALLPSSLVAGASAAYLVTMLAAAASGRGTAPGAPPVRPPLRVAVLVPAHDEAAGISAGLRALMTQDHPSHLLDVIVIADNCTDATAHVAAEHGADVWVRTDADHRGKGHALAWAIERLDLDPGGVDVVMVVDADCVASPNLVSATADAVASGAGAVQAAYRVANPEASTESALRAIGFGLMHDVRGAGKAALGLSCGLFGTGMGFTAELLRRVPWSGDAVTEDTEFHVRLVREGVVVRYVPEASVVSDMPTSAAAARDQHLRWEGGNAAIARHEVPELLREGLRRRDVQLIHVGIERLVPSQSLLAALGVASALGGMLLRRPHHAIAGLLALAGQGGYVLVGLYVARMPPASWRALAHTPGLVLRRLILAVGIARRGTPTEWARTEREPAGV